MNVKTKRIISFSAIGLILAVVIVLNIVCGIFFDMITVFLHGYGVDFNGEGIEQVKQAGDELCQEIAAEGIVMLKNENNALPLKDTERLNVFGWGATDGGFVISGSGSGSGTERTTSEKKLFLKGLTEAGFNYNEELISIYEKYKDQREGTSLGSSSETFFRLYEPGLSYYSSSVMQYAKDFSGVALIVLSRLGGENKDLPRVQYKRNGVNTANVTDNKRNYLQLSSEEEELIDLVTNAGFSKVIAIINTCNVMELGFLDYPGIDAALSVGGVGQSGALAIGRILKGEETPSGKTVDTYAYDMKSDPTYVNAGDAGVTSYSNGGQYIDYCEGVYVGYRYYETAAKEGFIKYDEVVQYPFGYGLSYTEFEWYVDSVSPAPGSAINKNTKIEIEISVKNSGSTYAGRDVVQVYFTAPYTDFGIEKPYVQLCAFAKTAELRPGQAQKLKISFDAYLMASYDYSDANVNGFSGYELEKGAYDIKIQKDSHTLSESLGDVPSVFTYSVSQNISFEKDPVTDKKVENQFTGNNAYGKVAIDGANSGANITYLSRAEFASTFPSAKKGARARNAAIINLGDKWATNAADTNEMPLIGQNGDLRLTYGSGSSIELNEELVMALGADYNDAAWELLLNQLTKQELYNLVAFAGYKTAAAPSIGKIQCTDLDGPSGLNQENMSNAENGWTSYPVETVLGSAWNSQLSYLYGLAVGIEAAATNISGWYAPAVNIHRSPFEGRNFEYYSEDPLLSGIMGAETSRGALANGLYCYIKHFAVNETETGRSGLYTWLNEQALREIYLRPFEIAVKEGGCNAVMTSFNRLGAVWAGGNYALLTTILRDEWGFKGSVLTDYSSGGDYMNVDQGLRAGGDCWLNPRGTINGFSDTNSATSITAQRRAAKNILFTYCNTIYTAKTHDHSQDRFVAEIGIRSVERPFPAWIFALIAIDLAAAGGLGVWIYFLLRKSKARTDTAA